MANTRALKAGDINSEFLHLASAIIIGLPSFSAAAQNPTIRSEELHRRTVERRSVDAVIWALPLVGEDAVKQAYFRDGKANYNDMFGGLKKSCPLIHSTPTTERKE
jgi:hypothetical protein